MSTYEIYRLVLCALFGYVLSDGGIGYRRGHFWVIAAILVIYGMPEK